MAASTVEGYVLHQWDWSETSLVLDVFTRSEGRLAVMARGAKRPYSHFRPVLMPFQPLRLVVTRPPARATTTPDEDDGDALASLKSADLGAGFAVLPPAQLLTGFYLNELLMTLLARGDAHEAVHDTYAATLDVLAHADGPDAAAVGAALRAFELVLLRGIGVLPALDVDGVTRAPLGDDVAYRLQPEHGVVAAPASREALPGRRWRALQAALDAVPMQPRVRRGGADGALLGLRLACGDGVAATLRGPLRDALAYHAGARGLRTPTLSRALRHFAQAPAVPPPPLP